MSATSSDPYARAPSIDRRAAAQFFLYAHVTLLIIVLIGFGPTFYLRALFGGRPLPAFLIVHGAVLTGWFMLVVVQAWLMHTGRVAWHRQVGFFAAGYAAVVVLMGLIADARMATEIKSAHDGDIIVVWGNLFSLIQFAAFVTAAVAFRAKPDAHKRLVLLASMSIIGPAAARFSEWSIFPGGMAARPIYGGGGLLLLFGSLIVYDIIVRRRPHPASWAGVLALIASSAIVVFLAVSGIGFELMQRVIGT